MFSSMRKFIFISIFVCFCLEDVTPTSWIPNCYVASTRIKRQALQDVQTNTDLSVAETKPNQQASKTLTKRQSGEESIKIPIGGIKKIKNTNEDAPKGGFLVLPTGDSEYPWKSFFMPLIDYTPDETVNSSLDNNNSVRQTKPLIIINNETTKGFTQSQNPVSEPLSPERQAALKTLVELIRSAAQLPTNNINSHANSNFNSQSTNFMNQNTNFGNQNAIANNQNTLFPNQNSNLNNQNIPFINQNQNFLNQNLNSLAQNGMYTTNNQNTHMNQNTMLNDPNNVFNTNSNTLRNTGRCPCKSCKCGNMSGGGSCPCMNELPKQFYVQKSNSDPNKPYYGVTSNSDSACVPIDNNLYRMPAQKLSNLPYAVRSF